MTTTDDLLGAIKAVDNAWRITSNAYDIERFGWDQDLIEKLRELRRVFWRFEQEKDAKGRATDKQLVAAWLEASKAGGDDHSTFEAELARAKAFLVALASQLSSSGEGVSPVREMYSRLAARHEERPAVLDTGGGVKGDRYPLDAADQTDIQRHFKNANDFMHYTHDTLDMHRGLMIPGCVSCNGDM